MFAIPKESRALALSAIALTSMTTERQEGEQKRKEAQRAQFQSDLDQILDMKASTLCRIDLPSEMAFGEGREDFDRALFVCSSLRSCDLSVLPDHRISELLQGIRAMLTARRSVANFNPRSVPNPRAERDQRLTAVTSAYALLFDNAQPALVMHDRTGKDLKALEGRAQEAAEHAELYRNQAKDIFDGAKAQTPELVQTVRQATGEAGVKEQAKFFAARARAHWRSAWAWLAAGGALIVFIVWQATQLLGAPAPATATPTELVYRLASRGVVLSTLVFALVYAGRNYRANRHNAVLNQHRDTALRNFRSFVVAAEPVQIKNAIFQQAAPAIFTPH